MTYKCPHCSSEWETPHQLNGHMNAHRGGSSEERSSGVASPRGLERRRERQEFSDREQYIAIAIAIGWLILIGIIVLLFYPPIPIG